MNNKPEYAQLCPKYTKCITIVSIIVAALGFILFVIGAFGGISACKNAKEMCNLTVINDDCTLSLLDVSSCEVECPRDFKNFNGSSEIKCYYDSDSMECPDVSCSDDIFPMTILIEMGLGIVAVTSCVWLWTAGVKYKRTLTDEETVVEAEIPLKYPESPDALKISSIFYQRVKKLLHI